jgi:hypothetical protein
MKRRKGWITPLIDKSQEQGRIAQQGETSCKLALAEYPTIAVKP